MSMSESPRPSGTWTNPEWVDSAVKAEPRLPTMAPYMVYLLLLMFADRFPPNLFFLAAAIHIAVAGYSVYLFRRHLPPWGRMHLVPAILVGLFAAWLWAAGQHWLNGTTLAGHNLGAPLFGKGEVVNPHDIYGNGTLFWTHVIFKITRAITIVPIVEELFWRGFILRAFISWNRFDHVPLAKFTLFSFVASSLLSVLQHPANWGVSIACWMVFNALFYWKKSLLCLMITHGVTNLALYIYVVRAGDWQFW